MHSRNGVDLPAVKLVRAGGGEDFRRGSPHHHIFGEIRPLLPIITYLSLSRDAAAAAASAKAIMQNAPIQEGGSKHLTFAISSVTEAKAAAGWECEKCTMLNGFTGTSLCLSLPFSLSLSLSLPPSLPPSLFHSLFALTLLPYR